MALELGKLKTGFDASLTAKEATNIKSGDAEATPRNSVESSDASYLDKIRKDDARDYLIRQYAQDIYNRRKNPRQREWIQEYKGLKLDPLSINKMLISNKVDPEDPNIDKILEKWDWDQAVQIYEREHNKRPVSSAEISGATDFKTAAEKERADEEKAMSKYSFPEEERDPVKAIALRTIYKVKKFEDLNAGSEESREIKFKKLTRKLWDEFKVHGFDRPNSAGKIEPQGPSDLDGEALLALYKKAKFENVDDVEYISQGDRDKGIKSGTIGDAGGEEGVVAKEGGRAFIVDHHAGHSKGDSSATKHLYKALVDAGLLEKSKALDNFVEFVTKEDNKAYTDKECQQIVENFESNLIGLQRYMSHEQLIKIFEDYTQKGEKLNPYEALPPEYLETLEFATMRGGGGSKDLKYVQERLASIRSSTQKAMEELIAAGFVVDTDGRFGKILLDIGGPTDKGRKKKLGPALGIETARAAGYGGIVFWNPESNSFSVQTANDLDFELPDGFNSRGHYWLKIPGKKELKTSLPDILGKLIGRTDYKIEGDLAKALEKEKVQIESNGELSETQRKLLGSLFKKAKVEEFEKATIKSAPGGSRINSLERMKFYLENIVRTAPEVAESFRDNGMEQILEYYRAKKKAKESGMNRPMNKGEQTPFKEDILEEIKEKLKAKAEFSKCAGIIINYYRNLFNIEHILEKAK